MSNTPHVLAAPCIIQGAAQNSAISPHHHQTPTTTKLLLLLVDGSSYLHRAYHALPPLTTTHGEPTGTIYGVINMLRKLLDDYHPDYIAVVFDTKGKNFRHAIYPAYKATRPSMPEELRAQIKPLHDVIVAMGLPLLAIDGVEADDVIATLARQAQKAGARVLISTGDKDLAQLVNDDITLINTMSNTKLDAHGVQEKFGVAPNKIIDYLALVGDSSDNVPGVPMIGPKTAAKLLHDFASLDGVMQNAHTITGKIGENLRQSLATLPLTRQLVTVKDDVPLRWQLHNLVPQPRDTTRLIELFKHLEFKSWLSQLLTTQPHMQHNSPSEITSEITSATTSSPYAVILDKQAFAAYLEKLRHAASFAFDLETTGLDIINAEIVGISLAINIGEAVYIPVAHDYSGAPSQLERAYVLQQLKPLLGDPHKLKLGQNLKFDISVLANYDIDVRGLGFDTMLESYVYNSASNRHDKETLVLKYLGKTITTFTDLAGKGSKQLTFNQIPLEHAAQYAASDADLVLQLHAVLWAGLQRYSALAKVLQEIEMPLISVLSRMERCGVKIDEALLHQQSVAIGSKLQTLEQDVYKIAGAVFNLNSPAQLQEVLFTKLQLPILHKTPKGQPSTAESVLQELALDYPLPKLILEYRSLSKLKSTYTDSLPKQINVKTGRVHTSYNQATTTTGRLSSTDPNLQNIPIRTEEGRRIRQAFIACDARHKIVTADYSQIELRIMAHLSQDPGLLQAFRSDSDVHRATAAEVFGVALDQVTTTQRQRAKMINFGLIYGMSAFGLAKRMGMSRESAQGYVDLYFKHYPGVKEYMDKAREQAQQFGYVETLCGRRLYVPDIKARNFQLRAAAERAAINAPMQGSAADMMKIAMIKIDAWIMHDAYKQDGNKLDVKMLMQVHDELVFEIAIDDVDVALPKIKYYMETALSLSLPILVQIGIGNNWDEAHR